MIYTINMQAADGSIIKMSLSDTSPGPQVAGGLRMTAAQIKAMVDPDAIPPGVPGAVCAKLFDNDAGLPVLSVVEEA